MSNCQAVLENDLVLRGSIRDFAAYCISMEGKKGEREEEDEGSRERKGVGEEIGI